MDQHNDLKVKSAHDYVRCMFPTLSQSRVDQWIDTNVERFGLIGQIVSTEVAIFLFRRTGGADFCGSVITSMSLTRKELIIKYEKRFGSWADYNKESM